MTNRTSNSTVSFRNPFILGDIDEVFPAGDYNVETEEELIDGLSFLAYRRKSTFITLLADPRKPGITQTLTVDPGVLDDALKRDENSGETGQDDASGRSA